jgi:low affinity Fe/Cu permease
MNELFHRFARSTASVIGSPTAFALAVVSVIVWAALGPIFHYSDSWQLVINTATTIITFLVVFAIQNTQNRDSRALHLKLDELIRAVKKARNSLVDIEELPDAELARLEAEFRRVRNEPQTQGVRR